MLQELLRNKGIKVQRFRLRDSIHCVDYIGVQARTRVDLKEGPATLKDQNNFGISTQTTN